MTEPLLAVRGLAITHDGADTATPADVTFDVSPGDVVLLLGPSGSGKSTLALALNGLIPHAVPADITGIVEVAGLDTAVHPVSALSAHVAMVFQDPDAQLVTGTLLDEVAFGPENLLVPAAEVLERSETALRRLGLWERRNDNPDRLSGGGRQRLAIAAALAMGSPVLVLDEPTANLDPQGIEEVYAALADVVAAGDRAIVLIEHNLDAAAAFVDRVVVLDHEGRVVADGPVDDVLRRRAAELHALGVWLPTSALAALRLRSAGYTLDPLPLTPGELRTALTAEPSRAPAPGSEIRSEIGAKDASGPNAGTHSEIPEPNVRAAGPPVVTVRDLRLKRGRTEVLHGIDLDIAEGEFVAVVGANGAGKTSLVQALAGVITPPKGTVHVDGHDVARTDARALAARIGFVFQNPEHQFVAHTVADELAYGIRHLPRAASEPRVAAMLARFGLAERAAAHPFLLSGGQKRRLSVGTALIGGAPILALDEPTFGQDRARADELLGLLGELNDAGTTIIVVTHDMQLVSEHADRTVLLAEGRVLADGPTGEVFADSAVIERAGLRLPPLRQALHELPGHPELARATRIDDLPGGAP